MNEEILRNIDDKAWEMVTSMNPWWAAADWAEATDETVTAERDGSRDNLDSVMLDINLPV